MKLSKSEEILMQYLWKLEKAFMKDILEAYPDPKPAHTTIATLLKRMIKKNFVKYETFGNSRQYTPTIRKNDYFSDQVNGIIKKFYNDSAPQFASFFTSKIKFTNEELEDLKSMIDEQIKKQQS